MIRSNKWPVRKVILTLLFLALCHRGFSQASHADEGQSCAKAEVLMENFQYEAALPHFETCLRNAPENMAARLRMAQCQMLLGRLSEASDNYGQVLDSTPENRIALNQTATILNRQGKLKESMSMYDRLIGMDAMNSFYHKQKAGLALRMGEGNLAIGSYKTALDINPYDLDIISALSGIYQKIKAYGSAEQLILKGLSYDSSNISLLEDLATVSYRQKKYRLVVSSLSQVFELSQDTSAQLLQIYGIAYYHLGEKQKAIVMLEKAGTLVSEPEYVHYYLGLAYRDQGQLSDSEENFRKAISDGISDNISIYYSALAATLEAAGNHEAAIQNYKIAYKASQGKTLLYHLARNYDTYYQDKSSALLYYQKYLATNDTGNMEYREYSTHRLDVLQELMHFHPDAGR